MIACRKWASLAILLSSLVAVTAEADVPIDTLRDLLSGYEPPPDGPLFPKLRPDAIPTLITLSQRRSERPIVRLRAIAATSQFAVPAVRTFLLAVAQADGQSDLFIREAVLALGRAFGARAINELAPFLDHRAPVVRESAALALVRVATPAARRLVSARLERERTPAVRDALTRLLKPTRSPTQRGR